MVCGDVDDAKLVPQEPGRRQQNWFRNPGVASASRESDVSLLNLRHQLRVGIEPADQRVPVFFYACSEVQHIPCLKRTEREPLFSITSVAGLAVQGAEPDDVGRMPFAQIREVPSV